MGDSALELYFTESREKIGTLLKYPCFIKAAVVPICVLLRKSKVRIEQDENCSLGISKSE